MTAIIFIILILAFAISYMVYVWIYMSKNKYFCPKCNRKFYPSKWKAFWDPHAYKDYVIICPHCDKKCIRYIARDTYDKY